VLEDRQGLVSSLAFFSGRGGIYFTSTMVCLTTHGAECARDGEEAIALARQLGWRSGEAFALLFLGLGLGPRGEYARAFTSAEAGLAIAREIEHGPWMATGYLLLGILSLEVLALSTAQQHLEQALALAKECGSLFLLRDATAFLASAYIAQREFARAEAALDAAFGLQTPCQTVAQRLVWRARAELELARGRPDLALEIVDRLIASAAHLEHGGVIPHLWYLRGAILAALARATEAESALRDARDRAQAQGARPLLWRIEVTLGKLSHRQGRREQAQEAFSLARAIVEELAASIPDEALRDGFLRGAFAQIPSPPKPSLRQAAKQLFGGVILFQEGGDMLK
jgi:tetratricopeptide (TPR) repeat protein